MVISHSYVSLPEGKPPILGIPMTSHDINPAIQDQESPGEPDVRISDPSVA